MTKPTILLSANSAWNVVNFRMGLIRGLVQAGYEVVVAAPADGHEEKLAAAGIRFVDLPMSRSGMNPVGELQLLARYRQLMRGIRPAAFLGFTIKPNIYGSLAARRAGIPIVNNISGLGTMFLGKDWQSLLARTLYRLALKRSAVVFFQNPEDRALFVEAGIVRPDQVRLLPGSGIDLLHYAPVPPANGPPVLLFIGRLLADKGVREFVEAARIVRSRVPAARFQLLGGPDPGNRTAVSAAEVEQWREEGQVELLGEASDVRPHIAQATAVVLPSYREGLPRVLLEAAAMARPLIATDVPGCRSIVVHGENGLLCPARDADALAESMEELVKEPAERRAAMGQAARRRVEEGFSERVVIDSYLAVLREIGVGSGVEAP